MSRRELETADASASRLDALKGLAESRGLPLHVVLRHASNNTLVCAVEHRSAERRAADKLDVEDKIIALDRRRRRAELRGD
jgi:hypothetical protein